MQHSSIDDLLPLVQKPGRYIGGEINATRKDRAACRLTFALAFPDVYEIGMSHLGLQILYAVLNDDPAVAAERVYAPWPDMEALMRESGIPLSSLESGTPLSEFDIVGFSLQYELSYTNVLNMLDLGRIPIYAAEREEGAPIVIAGGPCAFNPKPMAPFFDAFVIGEGEDVVGEIARAVTQGKEKGYARSRLLDLLAGIGGVWVPSLHGDGTTIRKRAVAGLERWQGSLRPIVPIVETVHDRITLEIARGCTRGCRFCQAGMVWRPVRERSPGILEAIADEMLASTGYDEISLLSLSSGDYSCIEHLLTSLMDRYADSRVAIGLPSLRVETLTEQLINQIKRVRKTSFTLAPEAGTQRLRDVINKGNTEEELLSTARKVFDAGWRTIKLYFMIGLPSETQEDLDGIVDLAYKVLGEGQGRRQVTVSISTFVPKPFTPFQWHRQITIDEIREKQDFFKNRIRHRNLQLKWHDREMSFLEGLLARGDERMADLVAWAFRAGCRFDGWSDRFRFDTWQRAVEETGIDPDGYLAARSMDDPLPWDVIDCGVEKAFLAGEYERSVQGQLTGDCRSAGCHACGVCSEGLEMTITEAPGAAAPIRRQTPLPRDGIVTRLRIRFAKRGKVALLSHLELSSAIVRAITISGFSFAFSEGFHPHPKISFPYALPVGIESLYEYADIQLRGYRDSPEEFVRRVNRSLPEGIEVLDAERISPHGGSLASLIEGFDYRFHLPPVSALSPEPVPAERIRTFLAADTFPVSRHKKGGTTVKDIRPLVTSLSLDTEANTLSASTRFDPRGGVRPLEILTEILGYDDESARGARIIKTRIRCKGEDPLRG